MHELRYAIRSVVRRPAFALVAIFTLAVGMGANTLCLTLLDNLALRPIPARDPERLARVYPLDSKGRRENLFWYQDYLTLRDTSAGLGELAAYVPATVTLGGRMPADEPREAVAYLTSPEYFGLLGAAPALGRTFLPAEATTPGTSPVAIVSWRLWKRLGGTADVLGSPMTVNARAFTIIGVMPRGFVGTEPIVADLWVPLTMHAVATSGRDDLSDPLRPLVLVLARLRDDVTRAQAEPAFASVARALSMARPPDQRMTGVTLRRPTFFPIDRDPLDVAALALAASLLLLGVATANVANLLLARTVSRRHEIAVRTAVGAGGTRLARLLLFESACLVVPAVVVALIGSSWALSGIAALAAPYAPLELVPTLFDLTPDARILAATVGLCTAAAMLTGLAPLAQALRIDVSASLHGSASTLGARLTPSRARALLVGLQVAASLGLAIAAGLLARGSVRADALDLGFSPTGVLSVRCDLARAGYSPARQAEFARTLAARAARLSGVASTTLASHLPLTGGLRATSVWSVERPDPVTRRHSRYVLVAPGYFTTLGIPLVRGRDVLPHEAAGGREAVVSEVLASELWPGQDPLGQSLRTGIPGPDYTVVGVARDTRASSLWRDKEAAVYLGAADDDALATTRVAVRVDGPVDRVAADLHRLVRSLEPRVVVSIDSLESAVRLWTLPAKAASIAGAIVAALALFIASLGTYGVMAHLLEQQRSELGIRRALGAGTRQILAFCLAQGLRLLLPGLAAGVLLGLATGRALGAFVFGVSPTDPATLTAAILLVGSACALACYLPARRATRVDPAVTLRAE